MIGGKELQVSHSAFVQANSCKKRQSNIELFRIVVMLLIVAHHYVVNSELAYAIQSTPLCIRSVFLMLFGAWGKTGINCFVLITGYFMCRSCLTVEKYVKLLFEVLFYRVVVYLCFLATGYETVSVVSVLSTLMPIKEINNGFTSCYLMFMLLIPVLNILIVHMTERNHIYLIGVCSFIYVVLGTLPIVNVFYPWFPSFSVKMNYVSWFTVLYFIGAFFRMYPKPVYENTKLWGWMTALFLAAASISVIGCAYISNGWGQVQIEFSYYFLSDSNKVMAVSVAICAFLFFKSLKIPYNKWINKVAASTYGVLLIHANSDAMRQWLWVDVLKNGQMFLSDWMPIHAIGSVLIVFSVCIVIDWLRIQFLEMPLCKLWDGRH